MADTTLTVDIDARDAITAINGLKTAMVGIITGEVISNFTKFADSLTNLHNRLDAVSSSAKIAGTSFNAIAAIALNTGASLKDVGDRFTKLQVATDGLGLSQKTVGTITDVLTKQLAIQGASTIESSSAMYQFSQAMALGKFQGNDLHSLMVTMPATMNEFAKFLGITSGQLRDLGSKGYITSQQMVDFLKSIEGATDEKFANRTKTIGQSFEILQTQVKLAFDELDKTYKISDTLSTNILALANILDGAAASVKKFWEEWGGVIKVIAFIASFAVAVGWIYKALIGLGAIFADIVLGIAEFGASIANFSANVIARFTSMSTTAAEVAAGIADLFGTGTAAKIVAWTGVVIDALAPIGNVLAGVIALGAGYLGFTSGTDKATEAIKSNSNAFNDNKDARDRQLESLDDQAKASAVAAEEQRKLANAMALANLQSRIETDSLKSKLDYIRAKLSFDTQQIVNLDELGNATVDFTNKSKDQIEIDTALFELQKERTDAIKKLKDEQAKLNLEYEKIPAGKLRESESARELAGKIGVIGQQIKAEERLYDNQAKSLPSYIRALQTAKILEESRKTDIDNINKSIEDQIARQQKLGDIIRGINDKKVDLSFTSSQRGLSPLQKQINDITETARKGALEAGRTFSDTFNAEDGLTPDKAQELADGLSKIAEGYNDIANSQIAALKNSSGLLGAWDEYKTKALDTAGQIHDSFGNFTQGMEDAFVKFVQTGKLSFNDLANSIISDLAKIAFKKAVVGIGSLFGFAAGGDVMGNTPIIVGERGPELFVPSTAGKIIPNNQLGTGSGSSAGGQTVVNYNIQAVDASSFRALVARDPSFIYAVTEQGRRSQPARRAF